MEKTEDVKVVVMLVPKAVDERVIRRALASGLQRQGWTPRSRGEQYLVVGRSDEEADGLIELARKSISVRGEVFRLDGDGVVEELRKIIFRTARRM